jgi:hypothetical protein
MALADVSALLGMLEAEFVGLVVLMRRPAPIGAGTGRH